MLPWFLMRDGQLKFQSTTTGCLWMLPWFLMRDWTTQVSINHNWLFMDVTMVPHEWWANSSFSQPQLVVYGCYHGSSWEMGQLKFQSTTTSCLCMLPWFLMRDGPTQVSNYPQLVVYGYYHIHSNKYPVSNFQHAIVKEKA